MTKHWFLPENSDVLSTLGEEAEVTVAGLVAFAAWAHGDVDAEQAVRASEHEADLVRRRLAAQLRSAVSTPVPQEDLFALSQLIAVVGRDRVSRPRSGRRPGPVPVAESALLGLPALVVAGHPFDVAALHPEGRSELFGVRTTGEGLVDGGVPQDEVRGRGVRHLPGEGVRSLGTGDGVHGGVDERALRLG